MNRRYRNDRMNDQVRAPHRAAWLVAALSVVLLASVSPAGAVVYTTHATPVGPVPGTNNKAVLTLAATSNCTPPSCATNTQTSFVQPGSTVDFSYDTDTGLLSISDTTLTMSDVTFCFPSNAICILKVTATNLSLAFDHLQPVPSGPVDPITGGVAMQVPVNVTATISVLPDPINAPTAVPFNGTFAVQMPDAHGTSDSLSLLNPGTTITPIDFILSPTLSYEISGTINFNFTGPFTAPLFTDGVETGDLTGWNVANTDNGSLVVDHAAALNTTVWGLDAIVNDTAGMYVEDDTPTGQPYYRAQFYLDPNTFDPGMANNAFRARVFLAFTNQANPRRIMAIVLKRQGVQYSIEARARQDDNTQKDSGFFTISTGPHLIGFELTKATNANSNDGVMKLYIDNTLMTTVSGIDNSNSAVDLVRLGALSLKTGASGSIYEDGFQSFVSAP